MTTPPKTKHQQSPDLPDEPDWQEILGIYKDYRDDLPYLMHLAYVRGVADTTVKESKRMAEYVNFNAARILGSIDSIAHEVHLMLQNKKEVR